MFSCFHLLALHNIIFHMIMARYSLFMLKVLLDTNKPIQTKLAECWYAGGLDLPVANVAHMFKSSSCHLNHLLLQQMRNGLTFGYWPTHVSLGRVQ